MLDSLEGRAKKRKDIVTFSAADLHAARCAVVLVHYNSARDALACLRALNALTARPACVIIADNASRPAERKALLEGWQALRRADGCEPPAFLHSGQTPPGTDALFLALPENSGFAGGNNAALRLLLATPAFDGVEAFWLLNTDTEPAPGALDALCARLNARPDAGLCGSTLCYAHAPDVVQAAGGCTLCPLTGRTSFLMGGAARSQALAADPAAVEARMACLVGASVLVRRRVLRAVGLLPEAYFLYYEDAAFGIEARRAGFSPAWAPRSLVIHKEGGSTGARGGGHASSKPARSRLMDDLVIRNRIYLIRSYYPGFLPTALASLAGVALNRLRRGQTDRLSLIFRAAWHGLRGRMGRPDRRNLS